ncbi:CHAD domain-containing protein [Pyxidicoccus parkwayensis]|uniref:CHAD domain-containing protein n=1 Tax=Pyxidicoccus parkwayensis TaxID=2813578 RepID=A0ABX7NSM6_9BACT|nr:CHAD domain-containing protein [Pyxidicoccus parkwaysis]QSQ20419.1 CHAD domain-containing protein [Pyxidicoccus parkwaysis]
MAPPTPIRGLGPDSRLGDAARRILAGRLADVRKPETGVQDGADDESVHDMRVATRRLRAALQVFLSLGGMKKLERDVKRLQDALGDVRDVHVQAAWLEDMAGRVEKEKRGARAGVVELRDARLESLEAKEKRLHAELKRWEKRTVPRLKKKLEALDDEHRFGGRSVRGHLRGRVRRVRKRMETYVDAPDAASAHALRKELKKLRYELEIFQPALRRVMDAMVEVLVPLQDGLGELHDADVRLELFERLAAESKPKGRKAARALLPHVRDERAKHAAEIARELQRWHSEEIPRRLRRMLA